MLCEYGCGKEGVYKLKNKKICCSKHFSSCPSIRKKNSLGLKKAHEENRMRVFTPEDVRKSNAESIKNSIKKAFVKNSTYSNEFIKPKFINMCKNYKCFICSINKWNNKPIVLELDHINGDNKDNRVSNLRLLCPNCHSQTPNFRGRNINKGVKKVTDNKILEALKEEKNIRQALLKVGLTPKGANYIRANKLKTLI